jgi:amino acid adenylation domain-containing protein
MEDQSFVGFQLSPFQQLIWPTQSKQPVGSVCRVSIEGEIDAERLRNAIETAAQRHESLRTAFRQPPGSFFPFQVIGEVPDILFEVTANAEETFAPGTFEEGPPLRAKLITLAPARHILVLRVSSLCGDTASLRNLVDQIAHSYQGREAAAEPVQYADFSGWHLELLASTDTEAYRAARQYWSKPHASQRLPLERTHPEADGDERSRLAFAMESSLLPKAADGLPEFLFGCWQTVLYRLTGQESVTVNYLCEGRPAEELRTAIGLFAHPVPVTVDFEDKPSFQALLTRSQEALAAANQWQSYSPIASPGSASHAPVERGFGFEFQLIPEKKSAADVSFSILEFSPSAWPNRISLVCAASAENIGFEFVYDSRVLSATDVARIANYLERTVRAAAQTPGASVAAFDLLDGEERRQAIAAAAGEAFDFDHAGCFHELFERQAALTPERAALVFEETEFTYAQLNARANQIAHWLREFGVGPNVPVGLCLERSAETIVGVLGILKAGGAYVPLLPDMPKARLAHQLAETQAPVTITTQALLEKTPGLSGRVLCLDRDQAGLDRQPPSNPTHHVTAEDLAYVLYTSGSTGAPKGVAVSHGNVTNYTLGICLRLGLRASSMEPGLTFASVSTLGADLGNTAIFPPLVTGGRLCILGYDAAVDARVFALRNRQHRIDVLKITPSNINALMLAGNPKEVLPRKLLIVGGEACAWDLVHRVHEAGECGVMNHYGPTETTVGCLTYPVARQSDPAEPWSATVPLGRPIPNLQVYVLDAELRPVPAGAAGEICISGAGVSKGYIERPDETRQRFPPHPFLDGGTALYRTGDRGRALASGAIEFLGRIDQQVKIRGHRVELGEIEAVLGTHAAVQQAVAMLSQDEAGPHLTAYVIVTGDPGAGVLERHLSERLPEYMMPGRIVAVDRFPLNANGKVDRRKLAELNPPLVKPQAGAAAPRNATEEQLVAMWKEVLKTERVGIADNFFELGGHSLLATLVVSRIRAAFKVQISIRALFESPTIESLALAIETADKETEEDQDIADLLSEMEGLSDEETLQLLHADGDPASIPSPAGKS